MKENAREQWMTIYEQTKYSIPELNTFIQIGEKNAILDEYCRSKQYSSWIIFTVWNPYSEPRSEEINRREQQKFESQLKHYDFLEANGIGTNGWTEEGIILFDYPELQLQELLKQWEQNALVYGNVKSLPTLIWNNSAELS